MDDYAHHLTEVAAGLETVAPIYPGRRKSCVFRPHQASRTAVLLDELAASLQNAERAVLSKVYRTREPDWVFPETTCRDGLALWAGIRSTCWTTRRFCGC